MPYEFNVNTAPALDRTLTSFKPQAAQLFPPTVRCSPMNCHLFTLIYSYIVGQTRGIRFILVFEHALSKPEALGGSPPPTPRGIPGAGEIILTAKNAAYYRTHKLKTSQNLFKFFSVITQLCSSQVRTL